MNAIIKLHGGCKAFMDDEGKWTCPQNRDAERWLNVLAELREPQSYLADPLAQRLRAVLDETGATLLERNIPPDESPPGLVH